MSFHWFVFSPDLPQMLRDVCPVPFIDVPGGQLVQGRLPT